MSKKVAALECQNCSVSLPFNQAKACGRCMTTNYCSADCQVFHWKKGGHKDSCKPYSRPCEAPLRREVERCSVCFEGFGETSCTLPCSHTFHIQCSKDLREFGLNCPLCRAKLPESPEKMCEETTTEYLKIRRDNQRPDGTRRPFTKEQVVRMDDLFRRMTEAAQQGHGIAQFNLGMFYWQGIITPKNEDAAIAWFNKSALNGCCYAQAFMGQRCHDNNDPVGSAHWWLKAAELNCPISQYNYGHACFRGEGVPLDVEKAFFWWHKAAEGGCAEAQGTLAQIKTVGVYAQPQDLPEAVRLFEKSKARLSVEMVAKTSYGIGAVYDDAGDHARALPFLMTAAKNGYPEARFRISLYYTHGRGVLPDAGLALKWLRRAADDGYMDAQNNYGIWLNDQGKFAEAFKWWEKSAAQGFAMAKFNMSLAYNKGMGVPVDQKLCLKLCYDSAEMGHAPAQYNMGCHFFEKDEHEHAFIWFKKAAGQGHVDALYSLAASYFEGAGVEIDEVKAKKLCRMAAVKGHVKAIEKMKMFAELGL